MATFPENSAATEKDALQCQTTEKPVTDSTDVLTCEECGSTFTNRSYFHDHKRWHSHLRKQQAASIVKSAFEKDRHMVFPSSTAGTVVSKSVKVEKLDDSEYLAAQALLKPFACEYCGWRFILKKDLVHHVRTHTGEKPYECSECGKRFARAHSLNQHKRVHEGLPLSLDYQTPPKQPVMSDQTDKHTADDVNEPVEKIGVKAFEISPPITVGDPGNPPNYATTPPWGYQTASSDEAPTASNTQACLLTDNDATIGEASSGIHGGGKRGVRFTCQFCGWGFWDRKDKRQHEWTHTGYKPYKCSMCDKTFSRTYSRTLHMRTHSGERPYPCQHCDKNFPSPSSLRSHENVHTKVRRHKCTMCPQSFKKMSDFKEHQLEHLGTEPATFTSSYSGASEVASVTNEGTSSTTQPFPVSISFAQLSKTSQNLPERNSSDSSRQSKVDINPTGVIEQPSEADQFAGPVQHNINNEANVSQSLNVTTEQRQTDVVPSVNTYSSLLSGLLKKKRDVRFYCQYCEKEFHTKKECHQHESSHTENKSFECSICGKNLSSKYLLKTHMMDHAEKTLEASHTNEQRHRCELCEQTFNLVNDFTEHLQLHQSEDPSRFIQYYPDGFNPGIHCQKATDGDTLSPLASVTINVPQTALYSAAPVPDTGLIQPQMTKKRNASTPRKKPGRVPQTGKGALRFGCSFCTRRFRCKKDWRQHENTHTGLKPYTCTVCGKKLSRHYTLKVHMLTHTGQKPISCSHCDKSFRVKSRLRTHERIHHAALCNPTLHNKCDLCQMAFKELSDLENHIRVGHDDVVRMMAKNFFNSTPVTSALFRPSSSSENPTQKLSVSSDEPYQDEITCTVRYISKRNRIIDPVAANAIDSWLEGNKVSGQARFMCHFCGKGFHNARDWQQHENTHTGYKPYACDICGKKLSRLHSLKAHKLRHLKGHPNVCQFYKCGRRFKEEGELEAHMKSHPSSFQCSKCQVCFETIVDLDMHMAEHDKEGQDSVQYQQVPSGPFFFKGNGQSPEKENESHSSGIPKKKVPFKPTPGAIRYQCSFCGWRTEDFDIFKRHKIWHRRRKNKAGQMKKSCNKCGAAFVTNEKLEIHLRTCGFLCSLCRKPFKTKLLLEEHLKRHSEAESINRSVEDESTEEVTIVPHSETAGKDLSGPSNVAVMSQETRSSPPGGQMSFNILESLLSRQNLTETVDLPPMVPKSFPGHNERKQSKKFVHATCRLCQKSFSHGYALKLHMVLHISETPYKCKKCAKRFRSKESLREHQNMNLSCSQGSIRPSTSTNVPVVPRVAETAPPLKKDSILYRQLKLGSHRDGRISKNKDAQQKPHQCSYCGWGFWLRKDCVVHERIHTGEKPYVCQTCGKSFARSYSLKLHNMTHSGVKPFHCRICNKGFYCRGNVNAHERIHTSEKPNLNCKWCGVPFRSRSGLKKHEKLRHSQELIGNANSINPGSSVSTDRGLARQAEPVKVIKSVAFDSLQKKSKSGVCSFCGWNFHNVERMRRHLYWHSKRYFGTFRKRQQLKALSGSNTLQKRPGKLFKCTTCNATFHHPTVLKLHGKSHSSEQLYYCDCCQLKFEIYTEFSRHNALHHSRFVCIYCDKFIDGSQELVRHKQVCRARRLRLYSGKQSARKVSLRCRRCKVTFRGPNAMRLHISHSHATANYVSCLHCQKGFTSHEQFTRHLLRGCYAPDTRFFKPVARSKQIGYNEAYMSVETNPVMPEVSPSGQIPYPDKSFEVSNVSEIVSSSGTGGWVQAEDVQSEGPGHPDNQDLVHVGLEYDTTWASTSKPFQCPYCASSFAQSFGLKQHVRIHTGEKPFICRECGRAFAQKINLNQHMATHSEEKPFKCQHCGKCFSRKVQIKRHLERMHSRELPYSCGQCPRNFKSVDELKRHCIVHFGKRQHACKYCGWTFAEKRDMVNHERVHTGEKPFSCKVCDMSFARTYSLKVHMRSHTGEKPHKCEVCSKGCSSAYNLKLHLKTHEKQQTLSESPMIKFWTENSQT